MSRRVSDGVLYSEEFVSPRGMASFNSLEKPIAPFLLMKERYFPTDFAPAGYYMIYTEGQLDHCPDDPTKMPQKSISYKKC